MKGFVTSSVTWIWSRWRLFLGYIAIILVVLFMICYVDGRQFFLTHHLSLTQANGTITRKLVFLPVQSDITTLISILASTARLVSTLWVIGIDLRCTFLFMERGGVTFEGLKSMVGGSLPGYSQVLQKRNYIIFAILQVAILMSAFTSSVVSGSVTWKATSIYLPDPIDIPLGRTGDRVLYTGDSRLLESFVEYSYTVYSVFYDNSTSSSMHRLTPDSVRSLPSSSKFEELTVPFFAIDAFEWITDPNSTLSPHQKNMTVATNTSGPRVMNLRKWGLLPDGNWGPYETTFPAPLTVSESRILVISGEDSKCNFGRLNSTIPSNVEPYVVTFNTLPLCFIFANVTYRAGAARCRRCQLSSPRVVRDVGDVKDLHLIQDSMTSAALAIAPYLSTSLYETGFAIPTDPKFPTMQTASIEILSRSYQVAWNGLTSLYGDSTETVNVRIAVDAPTASVLKWRLALWGILHAILVTFGFIFRHIHTSGRHPWIEDPVIAALLVDPTSLMSDPTWAGEDAPRIAAKLKLHKENGRKYIVLEREKMTEVDLEKQE